MKLCPAISLVTTLVVFVTVAASVSARSEEVESPPSAQSRDESAPAPVSIQSGCVILNGRYIEPPYHIVAVPDGVAINGHVVLEAMYHGPKRRNDGQPVVPFEQRIEKRLLDDALLLGWDDVGFGFLSLDRALGLLGILSTDASNTEKASLLSHVGIPWIDSEAWPDLVETMDLPAEFLAHRMANEPQPEERIEVSVMQANVDNQALRARLLQYLITVGGMAVTVFALGTILSHRLPAERHRWREVNPLPEGRKIVVQCVALLMVLAVMDLLCTTYSRQASGFWELNPLGDAILGTPLLLACFKIAITLFSCTILFVLRKYYGAQQAAWWLATFCTVLALRWVTFNSMFLA